MLPPSWLTMAQGRRARTSPPGGTRTRCFLGVLLGTLALAGCRGPAPTAAPPADPPSGPIRPGEPIPYATLAEHLRFNTKSRMQLMQLSGQEVQVRGPVWKVERDDKGALLHLGTEQGSCVRARFVTADRLKVLQQGQEVSVVGTLQSRGDYLLLEDARLPDLPAPPLPGPPARP